jgi:hypothetical protein
VCQRSNGYTAPTVVCRGTVKRYSARLRVQKAHRTVNSDCPMAQLSEAPTVGTQRPGDVAGAPDCPVRHTTEAFTNGQLGGWGYKYPQPPLQDTNKEIKSSPKSKDHSNQIVTTERDNCVHLSSCAWIAFLLPSFLFQLNCNQGKRHQLCGGPCGDLVSRLIEKRSSLGLGDRLREGKG